MGFYQLESFYHGFYRLMLKEERRQQLFVKLSRTVEFQSKEERDRAIMIEKQ